MKITEQEIADYMIEREFSDLQMQSVADVFAEFAEISPIICTVWVHIPQSLNKFSYYSPKFEFSKLIVIW